jgi:hypothetical protein
MALKAVHIQGKFNMTMNKFSHLEMSRDYSPRYNEWMKKNL